MTQTGRYRFRRGWLGPVLQAEWIDDELVEWQDVDRRYQRPTKVFAIVRPSEWAEFEAMRGKKARAPRRRKEDEAEVSRFAP